MITDERFHELDRMEQDFLRREREREQDPDPNIWRWSPNPLSCFRAMLGTAVMAPEIQYKEEQPTFFEAGCGPGTKLALAEEDFGLRATGWDVIPEYIDWAQSVLGTDAILRDLDQDEPAWAEYDIIYISRPWKDDQKERIWEAHVQACMRPGAILMASFAAIKPYSWRWLYRSSWRIVAVKPMPNEPDRTHLNVPNAAVSQP